MATGASLLYDRDQDYRRKLQSLMPTPIAKAAARNLTKSGADVTVYSGGYRPDYSPEKQNAVSRLPQQPESERTVVGTQQGPVSTSRYIGEGGKDLGAQYNPTGDLNLLPKGAIGIRGADATGPVAAGTGALTLPGTPSISARAMSHTEMALDVARRNNAAVTPSEDTGAATGAVGGAGGIPDPFGLIGAATAQSRGKPPNWTDAEWKAATGGTVTEAPITAASRSVAPVADTVSSADSIRAANLAAGLQDPQSVQLQQTSKSTVGMTIDARAPQAGSVAAQTQADVAAVRRKQLYGY